MIQRLLNYWDSFQPYILQVSGRCQLRCGGCNLWITPNKDAVKVDKRIYDQIQKKTFFNHHPRTRLYHIIGGEPTLNPALSKILTFLKNEAIRCRLWTNGNITIDQIEIVTPLVEHIHVYLPGYICQIYRDITGEDTFEELVDNLRYMRDKKISFSCHFPIRPDNIDTLPEIYELAYQEKFPLMLHYCPSDGYTGDSLAFIERYRMVNGVSVYRHKKWPETGCPALPMPAVVEWRQRIRRTYDDFQQWVMMQLKKNLDHRI